MRIALARLAASISLLSVLAAGCHEPVPPNAPKPEPPGPIAPTSSPAPANPPAPETGH